MPEPCKVRRDVLESLSYDQGTKRFDGCRADLVAAADRERQAVPFEPGVGLENHVRRRVVGIHVDRVRADVRARRRKPKIEDLEVADDHDARAPVACLQRSSATAATMIVPVTICCTQLGRPCCEHPTWMIAMIAAPAIVPMTLPLPPEKLPPPMMTAAITSSSRPTETVGSPTDSCENSSTPARPASAPEIAYTPHLHQLMRTPHNRAVRSFDPMANRCRPKRVYRRVSATSTATITVIQIPPGRISPLPSCAVRSRLFSHVIGASTRRSSARPFAAPRASSIVPSVTMNGTTRSCVIKRPFTAPQAAAAPTAPSAAIAGPAPALSSSAVTTVLSAPTEPTDRSMPPEMMTIVIPSAATQTMTVWRAISSRFAARKNWGPMSAPKIRATTA